MSLTKPLVRILEAIDRSIPASEREKLLGAFQPYKIAKSRVLVAHGEVSGKMYFIQKGVMRAYYTRGEEDVTSLMASDGEAVCIAASFFRQQPSEEILETLEDCIVYSITYELYRELTGYDTGLAQLTIELLENQLINFGETIRMFKYLSVEQRISHYVRQPASVFRRIPDQYIATYLGTTGATFSRCLKNVEIDRD
ncbi:hypothetical protein GCM10023091_25430 [Ravibacter arvi]|uniref:Cyclic nucleotide-binding domain-containing protein n=1 Tax=Ravibacter arvi TaxID=2051041 RepID=A0ABP8M2D6_9BACT